MIPFQHTLANLKELAEKHGLNLAISVDPDFELLFPDGLHAEAGEELQGLAAKWARESNGFTFWEGARMGHGPSNHFDVWIRGGAGGSHSFSRWSTGSRPPMRNQQ